MTIKQFKNLVKDIPDSIDLAIGGQSLMPISPTKSGIVQLEFNDTGKRVFVFILEPSDLPTHTSESEAELADLN